MSGPPEIPELAYTDPIAYSLTLPPIYHLSPAYGAITDDNHGAHVVIVAWIMMCFFSLSVLTRLLTRLVPITLGGADDILSGLSMVFGIAQTGIIHRAATTGLGQPQDLLSSAQFKSFAKDYYMANLFSILAVSFAKASLIFLIVRLSPAQSIRRICYGFLAMITVWGLVFLFLFAFQGPLPRPWDYTNPSTISTSGLYYAFAATDIATDLLVTLLPAYVICSVQIPLRKRITVIAVFTSRLVVPLIAAIRIPTLSPFLNNLDDNGSWEAVTPQCYLQIIQCLSIITACIPCLKPFLESLESGFMDLSMTHRTGVTYGAASSGSGNHSGGGLKKKLAESYVMESFATSSGGRATPGEIDVHTKASERYTQRARGVAGNHHAENATYLDSNSSVAQQQPRRNVSVTESERALTSKSSDGSHDDVVAAEYDGEQQRQGSRRPSFGKARKTVGTAGAIKVTREVEVC